VSSSWQSTKLKYLASVPITNGLGEAGQFDDRSWPRYVRTTDIAGPQALRDDTFASLPPAVARKAPLLRGDILMTAAGATIGKSTTYNSDDPACYAGFLVRFRPASSVDGRFVAHWMQSRAYWDQIQVGAVRSTIDNFSAGKYRDLTLRLPALAEQRRIADFLDDQVALLDRAIVLRQQQTALAQEQQQAAVLRAVTGQDRGLSASAGRLTWAASVVDDWPVAKIVHHARLGSGHTPSRSHPEWWSDCVVPWITTGEVAQVRDDRREVLVDTRERLSFLGIANSSAEVHPRGTVVLSRTASAGFSAVMGSDMATSQDFVTWTCKRSLEPFFLLWCLRAMRPDLLGRLAMGSTHKTIYVPDIQGIRIPVPPVEVQRDVVARVRNIRRRFDNVAELQAHQVGLLQERKQALITAAVTGQFDVTTASTRGTEVALQGVAG
jgi:type I restriction enzyme S subunit